jgi:hypothetical protein
VLENLLHMAAHGLAAARGISDTSRRGQYHNKKDRELAEVGPAQPHQCHPHRLLKLFSFERHAEYDHINMGSK